MAQMMLRHFVGGSFRNLFCKTSASLCATSFIRSTYFIPCVKGQRYFRNSSIIWCQQATKTSSFVDRDTSLSEAAELLANLSNEEVKRLKVLKLEYDVFYSTGIRVPEVVSDVEWLYLLKQCSTVSSRKKRYSYLFKTEKSRSSERAKAQVNKQKQDEKRAHFEQMKKDGTYTFLNTFMLFLQEQTMNRTYKNNLAYAMLNGPHLVFDLSFEYAMSEHELTNLINQLQLCHGENKVIREPFHFHFCNLTPGSRTDRKLRKGIPNLDELPISVTHQNYLDCYSKESLVYLSPNAPTLLKKFNVDDVYVVGGIVDKAVEDPLTFAKAKKENIRTARFPLDEHVKWVQGSKSLTLNQVVRILLHLKQNNDWKEALVKNLPKRKYDEAWINSHADR